MEYVPKKTFVEMPLEAVVDRVTRVTCGMPWAKRGPARSRQVAKAWIATHRRATRSGFEKGDRIGKTQFYYAGRSYVALPMPAIDSNSGSAMSP